MELTIDTDEVEKMVVSETLFKKLAREWADRYKYEENRNGLYTHAINNGIFPCYQVTIVTSEYADKEYEDTEGEFALLKCANDELKNGFIEIYKYIMNTPNLPNDFCVLMKKIKENSRIIRELEPKPMPGKQSTLIED